MSDTAAALACPKCQGAMRAYERAGVTIDQCQECRGVFLDRGELDRIIDGEEQRYATPPEPFRDDERSYRRDDDHGDGRGSKPGGNRRRGGFLGELFD